MGREIHSIRKNHRPLAAYLLPLGLVLGGGCDVESEQGDIELEERAQPILCAGDECVDGVRDMTLRFVLRTVDFRSKSFKPGDKLHLSGYETICWDSPCTGPAVFVRTLNSDKLLAANFDADRGESLSNSSLFSSRLEPMSIDIKDLDDGLCPASPDPDCSAGRGTIDVVSTDDAHPGYLRLVERTAGWAPGGYRVSSSRLTVEEGPYCEGGGAGSFSIIRDNCDADKDCPEADVADSCEAPQGPYDWVRASFPGWGDTYGRYEAHCEVMGLDYGGSQDTEIINVDLDCAFITAPKVYEEW